jgi:DUF4097 and DUF4098 domain-containing protein YvlB
MLIVVGFLPAFTILPSRAGNDVELVRSVPADGWLLVKGVRGSFEIVGWDQAQVRVRGELDDLAEGLTFEVEGEKALLRVDMPERGVNWGDGSNLQIHVPRGIHLRVGVVSAEVALRQLDGDVGVRTVSGDVQGKKLGSHTHVKTTSGDVELSGATGSVRVVTTSGDASLELTVRDVQVDTMSGDVELALGGFDFVRANSISGELTITGALNPAGRLEGGTVSGDIDLQLASPVDAVIDCRTGPGGDIDNRVNPAEAQEDPGGASLKTTVGDGRGTVRLSTVSGTLRLKPR